MATETTPAIEWAADALRADETKRLGVEKTLTPERAIKAFWRHIATVGLTAALDGHDGGDAHTEAIHDVVCDGRSMEDCDGLCGKAFDALRASILGAGR